LSQDEIDRTAQLDELLESEIPHLRRYARFLARNVDLADDLVQDCLERAIANKDKWVPGTNLRAWLFVILRNAFINDRRRAARWTYVSDDVLDFLGIGVSGRQEERQELIALQRGLDQLSADHREILLLVAVEGFEYREVANLLSVPIGTVRSRLARARVALGSLLNPSEDGIGESGGPARP